MPIIQNFMYKKLYLFKRYASEWLLLPGSVLGSRNTIVSKNKYKFSSKNFLVSKDRPHSTKHTFEIRCRSRGFPTKVMFEPNSGGWKGNGWRPVGKKGPVVRGNMMSLSNWNKAWGCAQEMRGEENAVR